MAEASACRSSATSSAMPLTATETMADRASTAVSRRRGTGVAASRRRSTTTSSCWPDSRASMATSKASNGGRLSWLNQGWTQDENSNKDRIREK
eukprot:scaffold28_cov312-Pinguiococcus_pyrenoidosus.AAC.15